MAVTQLLESNAAPGSLSMLRRYILVPALGILAVQPSALIGTWSPEGGVLQYASTGYSIDNSTPPNGSCSLQ